VSSRKKVVKVVIDEGASANAKSESRDSFNIISKKSCKQTQRPFPSIYEEIEKFVTPTTLSVEFRFSRSESFEKMKSAMPSTKNLMIGRVVFGNFINPDTRSAQQDASIRQASAAAFERRNQAMASRTKQNEYDTSRSIESDVTSRMQRLAASKRNTKKGKTK